MATEQDFPVQAVDEPDSGALRWTGSVIALTAVALALFNAGAIAAWTEDLVPTPGTTRVVMVAENWNGATARIGLGTAHARMRRTWKRLEDARWPERHFDRKPVDSL